MTIVARHALQNRASGVWAKVEVGSIACRAKVFKSIEHYGLDISRAAFVGGRDPCRYIKAFNAALFLSANLDDVKEAIAKNAPAGRVFRTDFIDDEKEVELRIAFDFDGVIADDSSEAVYKGHKNLADYFKAERERATVPLPVGPLYRFFMEISKLQQRELTARTADPNYKPRVRTAIVTARNAPAHERVITSLREWKINVDEAFFLGGINKAEILKVFKPHIFFDDQLSHIESTRRIAPSAHVPFGIGGAPSPELIEDACREKTDTEK